MHEAFRIKYTIIFVLCYSLARFYFYLTKSPGLQAGAFL